ncbi:MAG: helix-turn-helix domain-containing protein [Pseudomonadota bacterium]|nr:helix-turn-helix domain-containing protein [Pseudomonadota bacterium]
MEDMVKSNSATFYAVRPDLVLRAARLFNVRASILSGGARSLYNKAVALDAGKAPGRWGKHQRAVIKQFCEYTVTIGSEALLPWQELVEDEMSYDGKEGISARTGNRPLATVQRVAVNVEALKQARATQSLELTEIAKICGLPIGLLQAIENGEWGDIASSTAESIATALGVSPESLFIYVENPAPSPAVNSQQAATPERKSHYLAIAIGGLAMLVLTLFVWLKTTQPMEDFTSSQWRMSVELKNQNIPIPEDTIKLWHNGGYLQLREHGVVAFNWIDPGALVELPYPEVSWVIEGNQLTLTLDNIVYPFAIGEDREKLVTMDTTRSFEMTLQAILK